jgi:hypothetical protein
MTRAQVQAASNGALHSTDDPTTDAVTGDYRLAGFKFTVHLQFEGGQLSEVTMNLDGTLRQCSALGAYLKRAYGPPQTAGEGGYDSIGWADNATGNLVTYSTLSGGVVCEVVYDPLSTVSQANQ